MAIIGLSLLHVEVDLKGVYKLDAKKKVPHAFARRTSSLNLGMIYETFPIQNP